MEFLRYSILQFVSDQGVYIEDRISLADQFKTISTPSDLFAVMITLMILSLAFFMMVVSFSQKVKDLTWEQGVLRSIGLT